MLANGDQELPIVGNKLPTLLKDARKSGRVIREVGGNLKFFKRRPGKVIGRNMHISKRVLRAQTRSHVQ